MRKPKAKVIKFPRVPVPKPTKVIPDKRTKVKHKKSLNLDSIFD